MKCPHCRNGFSGTDHTGEAIECHYCQGGKVSPAFVKQVIDEKEAVVGDIMYARQLLLDVYSTSGLSSGKEPRSNMPYAKWVRIKGESGAEHWELRCDRDHAQPIAASVWDNATWHTWDNDGTGGETGGENGREETVEKAKIEAAASAIQQGFI